MKVLILAVGRPERSPFATLFEDYAQRIRRLGVALDARFVPATREGKRFTEEHVREREARAVEAALPGRGRVIALSASGRSLGSETFARRLERWASPMAAFVIGGPLGLAPAFRESADDDLSLSPMTFAHELARVVLVEQIYRAVTILRRVPYHK
ncbi:MAG TPA: 23S rRNA (pseudouridine(1915)-N(3))-methyltransferase RlmH [Candidatus Polarisedimenticolaceae bacterium]|nr:23S rRNA (pseudouridine(1915)-N(3))-methyltransferase RlmH [Candidatus Polarisedimenticolaceae bacterium]